MTTYTCAKAKAKSFGSWMHGNGHVQISQRGARGNTLPRLYLKGDWSSQNSTVGEESDRDSEGVDKGAVFRHWYDLARSLGVCSGQKMKEGVQWVLISGSWERWDDSVKRGYSLQYLKTKMRN